jgi:hypothetical protein
MSGERVLLIGLVAALVGCSAQCPRDRSHDQAVAQPIPSVTHAPQNNSELAPDQFRMRICAARWDEDDGIVTLTLEIQTASPQALFICGLIEGDVSCDARFLIDAVGPTGAQLKLPRSNACEEPPGFIGRVEPYNFDTVLVAESRGILTLRQECLIWCGYYGDRTFTRNKYRFRLRQVTAHDLGLEPPWFGTFRPIIDDGWFDADFSR